MWFAPEKWKALDFRYPPLKKKKKKKKKMDLKIWNYYISLKKKKKKKKKNGFQKMKVFSQFKKAVAVN